MDLPRNRFKHALAKGELQIGLWAGMCSPIAAEILVDSNYDWVVVDGEHSPNTLDSIMAQLQVFARGTTEPVVRTPWNDMVMTKLVLDIGATTLLLPYVQNVEEAKRAVDSVRYPPRGNRGAAGSTRASHYGRVKNYFAQADKEICVLIQAETKDAVDQIEKNGRAGWRRWHLRRAERSLRLDRPSRQSHAPRRAVADRDRAEAHQGDRQGLGHSRVDRR